MIKLLFNKIIKLLNKTPPNKNIYGQDKYHKISKKFRNTWKNETLERLENFSLIKMQVF